MPGAEKRRIGFNVGHRFQRYEWSDNSKQHRATITLDSGACSGPRSGVYRHTGLDPASRDKKEGQVFSLELVKDQPGSVFQSDGLRILVLPLTSGARPDATNGPTTASSPSRRIEVRGGPVKYKRTRFHRAGSSLSHSGFLV